MDVTGQKISMIGLGETSLALVRLLIHLNARPFVSEFSPRENVERFADVLDDLGVPYECGGHTDAALVDATLVIPSPGVPPMIPIVQEAQRLGIPVVSELEFSSRYCRSTIIAVTGTNGKTTTTELIAHVMRTCGLDVGLCGNNETPLSALVAQENQPDYLVLEVSSYQLELVDTFAPSIGVVLNVSNDHLARHKTMENYAATKARMFSQQGADCVAILNADDPIVSAMESGIMSKVLKFSQMNPKESVSCIEDDLLVEDVTVAQRSDSALPGEHNTENILATLAVMSVLDADCSEVSEGLKSFGGVEHRIELTAELTGISFYNDSKSTNLDSLKVALESFVDPIVLIAGGDGKGSDYSLLRELVQQHVKALVAIGTDASKMVKAWGSDVHTEIASSMSEAVRMAYAQAESGDVVLLSPACASFDMYNNFEERGNDFKTCVQAIVEESAR